MFRSKNILWITFAFCLTTGSCTDFFKKSGSEVKMDCADANSKTDIVWKVNNTLVLSQNQAGRQRKGSVDPANRARIEGAALKITQLKSSDNGVYTCSSNTHKLYVVSAYAYPPSVLYLSETTLSCDVAGDFKGTFEWLTSDPKLHGKKSKNVTVKSVTLDNARNWTCQIKNEKNEDIIKLQVDINVVGPLNTPGEVKTHEGDRAELPCFLPATSPLPIIGGSWKHESHPDIRFPVLMRIQNSVQWNSTDVSTDKVTFIEQKPKTQFGLTLKKVKLSDAGMYVCSLMFENGKALTSSLNLTVSKIDGKVPDMDSGGSTVTKNSMWNKRVWGVQLWVWTAVAVSSFVLIGLVVIILLIHCRNKLMKRKMMKLKSMRQPHTSKNYCECDRPVSQAGTGKRGRPPPLPRHQYSSLNE